MLAPHECLHLRVGAGIRSAAGEPWAIAVLVCASRNTPSSAMANRLGSSWLTMTMVAPRPSRRLTIRSSSRLEVIGSSPAEGSSKNRMSGSSASARARPARLRMPPLSSDGKLVDGVFHTDQAELQHDQATDRDVVQRGEHLHRQGDVLADRHRAPERRILEQHAEALPADLGAALLGGGPVVLAIDQERPTRGRSRPIMDFSTVLLPQPLPPMTAKMLPRRTSKDRSCWMTLGPNARVMPRKRQQRRIRPAGETGSLSQIPTTSARTAKIASMAMTPTMPTTTALVAAVPTSAALRPA